MYILLLMLGLQGQSLYFQEVVITHNGVDYAFRRQSIDCEHWDGWISKPPWDHTATPKSYKVKKVEQELVWKILGPQTIKYLENRPKVSGYYNFTNDYRYDFKNFGGDTYGTFSKTIRVYQ